MNQTYLIGVDIGTQGTKSALYRSDGLLIEEAFEKSNLITPGIGEFKQNPDEIYGSVLRTIKHLIQKSKVSPGSISAVGMDAQMAGIMGIDEEWNAVTPYDSWLDTKCTPYINVMKECAWDEIIQKTGGQVTYAHGPKIIWWMKERPDIYKKTAKFIMLTTYVAGRLCGLKADNAYIDYTHLHFSGFADNENLKWDINLLHEFGVQENKMPRIISPSSKIGILTEEASLECGLLSGTPVVAGCGDSAASSLGAGITGEGMAYDVAGTASIFSLSTKGYSPDVTNKTIMYARSCIKDLWIPLAYISGGGMCINWFKQLYGLEFEELEQLAKKINPGSEGVLFVPHFAGRTCPNVPNMNGSFVGLAWNHTTGHLYRSILESIAFEYDYYYNILKQMDNSIHPVGIYGAGGGSKCSLFNQIKADVLGIPYYPLKSYNSAGYGSALLAGCGIGIYKDLQEVAGNQVKMNRYNPVSHNTKLYREYSSKYERLLTQMEILYTKLGGSNDIKN